MYKKSAADRKSVTLLVRVTRQEASLLRRLARLEGVLLSELLRRLIQVREGLLPANPAEFRFEEPPPKKREQRIELAEKR